MLRLEELWINEALFLQNDEGSFFIITFGPWTLIMGSQRDIYLFQSAFKKSLSTWPHSWIRTNATAFYFVRTRFSLQPSVGYGSEIYEFQYFITLFPRGYKFYLRRGHWLVNNREGGVYISSFKNMKTKPSNWNQELKTSTQANR